jgi:cyclopropane-fatty-acyl-phospholipid synthase
MSASPSERGGALRSLEYRPPNQPAALPDAASRNAQAEDTVILRAPQRGGTVRAVEKWLLRNLLHRIGNPSIGVTLWDGQRVVLHEEPVVAMVRIRDRRTLLGLLANPEVAFGDAYSEGRIEVEGDLLEFLQAMFRAASSGTPSGQSFRKRVATWLLPLHRNTLGRSRGNVYHHYDIGDDFYRLWLDEQMVYTCAYFPDPDMTIDQAQRAKMDYVCRKLRLRSGETVAEAGFGWGALAMHMVRNYGVRVRAYNLSRTQTRFARERAAAEGLDSHLEFVEEDYRNLSGQFDVFVSVGMLEHVGKQHYRQLGEVIHRCLKPTGRGLIHSIGRNQPVPFDGWTERRIFPGAYPPSLCEMLQVLQPYGFSVLDVENLRQHYAQTLRHWLARYRAHEDQVIEMFDERFARMWRLYLTGSIAGFATGKLQLFQVLFTRSATHEVPWTREWLYADL